MALLCAAAPGATMKRCRRPPGQATGILGRVDSGRGLDVLVASETYCGRTPL